MEESEKLLKLSNKQFKINLQKKYKSIRDIFMTIFNTFLLSSTMTASEKIAEVNKYGRLDKLIETISTDLTNTNKENVSIINNNASAIYQTNYNSIINELNKLGIEAEKYTKKESYTATKENENPFTNIALDEKIDKAENEKLLRIKLTSDIINNKTSTDSLKSVKVTYEKNLQSLQNINNNETFRIENLARLNAMQDSQKKANNKGKVILKVWNTQGDKKVRDRHARADGQTADLDRPFYVGGEKLMYPKDPNGSPNNTTGCRCYITYKIVDKP